jgi:anaerobic selenocysteine-containing dehydrogenase
MALVASMESYTWTSGTDMGNGVTRYTNGTNGGPIFVYVKDGKILRTTPMDLDDTDAGSYTIKARGKTFVPPRKTTLAAHGHCQKSMVYSKNRILKPMKRVDFDPHGERNIQNRGKSKFVEISWEEALDIVSGEIKRCKAVGPGAICVANGSHHQWGNLGHYLSAFNRFWNLIGTTKLVHNPDSWEGWFWGAMHHWGNSMRLGAAEPYGTVEDCLKEADMMVFWSSDPDATYGFEGTRAPPLGQGARHQDGAHRSVHEPHGRAPRRQVALAEAGHRCGLRPGALSRLDHRRHLRQGVCREAHHRLCRVEGARTR